MGAELNSNDASWPSREQIETAKIGNDQDGKLSRIRDVRRPEF